MGNGIVIINFERTEYRARDVRDTLTVGELLEYLECASEELGENARVVIGCDHYTYGAIRYQNVEGYED